MRDIRDSEEMRRTDADVKFCRSAAAIDARKIFSAGFGRSVSIRGILSFVISRIKSLQKSAATSYCKIFSVAMKVNKWLTPARRALLMIVTMFCHFQQVIRSVRSVVALLCSKQGDVGIRKFGTRTF